MSKPPRKLSRAKQFAAIEHLSIAGSISRLGPAGLWVYADAFRAAAASLPAPAVPYEPVRYYLACHSIELSLKAYLSLHGATMLELSENAYGHDLVAILAAADAKGLLSFVELSREQRDEINAAAVYYGGKVFEYPAMGEAVSGYPKLPNIDVLIEIASTLTETLRKPCMEA